MLTDDERRRIHESTLREREALLRELRTAIDHLEVVEPASLRAPLRLIFTTKIALVESHRSHYGLPVNHALDAAYAVNRAWVLRSLEVPGATPEP